jgi:hypothetical protein
MIADDMSFARKAAESRSTKVIASIIASDLMAASQFVLKSLHSHRLFDNLREGRGIPESRRATAMGCRSVSRTNDILAIVIALVSRLNRIETGEQSVEWSARFCEGDAMVKGLSAPRQWRQGI